MTGYDIPFYARTGARISSDEWMLLASQGPGPGSPVGPYRVVGLDRVGEITISTVWIGYDPHHGTGTPRVYETLVTAPDHTEHRHPYTTEAEAIEGHAEHVAGAQDVVARIRAAHEFLGSLGRLLGFPDEEG